MKPGLALRGGVLIMSRMTDLQPVGAEARSTNTDTSITGAYALGRVVSWTLVSVHELYGDSGFERIADALGPKPLLALARAIENKIIPLCIAGNARKRAAALTRVRRALADGAPEKIAAAVASLDIDCGGFHSWLALASLEELCGAPPPVALGAAPLQRERRDVSPLEAITRMLGAEPWSSERMEAHIARRKHTHDMLFDDQIGRARLSEAAQLRLRGQRAGDLRLARRFEAMREKLQQAIIGGEIEAYSADTLRRIEPGNFAASLWLDARAGRFLPASGLELLCPDWVRARYAAEKIGAVRLSAAALLQRKLVKPSRSRVTVMSRRRAETDLRRRAQNWLDGGPIPIKAEWMKGPGADIAGSQSAARDIWSEVTLSDARYAALRERGRRRKSSRVKQAASST